MNSHIITNALPQDDAETYLCSENPPDGFLSSINDLCKQQHTHFETWMEMVFLKVFRVEEDSNKIYNLFKNINSLIDGEDIRNIFYDCIFTQYSSGLKRDYFYKILNLSNANIYTAKYLADQSSYDLKDVINDFSYNGVLDKESLYLCSAITLTIS